MKLVMRFAKRENDGTETVREKVIPMKTFGTQHFNWHEAVTCAIFHAQSGERIVAMIEEGTIAPQVEAERICDKGQRDTAQLDDKVNLRTDEPVQ